MADETKTKTSATWDPESWTVLSAIQYGVPLCITFGVVYLLGYIARVDLQFFSFFDLFDYASAALAVFPPLAVVWLIRYLQGNLGGRIRRVKAEKDSRPYKSSRDRVLALQKPDGSWREGMLLGLEVWWTLTIGAPIFLLATILSGIQIEPLWLALSSLFAAWSVTDVLDYLAVRFEIDLATYPLLLLLLLLGAFGYGYIRSGWDQSESAPTFALVKTDNETLLVKAPRKAGSHLLAFDTAGSRWMLISEAEVKNLSRLPATPKPSNRSASSK